MDGRSLSIDHAENIGGGMDLEFGNIFLQITLPLLYDWPGKNIYEILSFALAFSIWAATMSGCVEPEVFFRRTD